MTAADLGSALRSGELTCVTLVRRTLDRIAERNPVLNAFITITGEAAEKRAIALDRELAGGRDRGPLHGIPVAIKDNLHTAGVRTTGGSRIFAEFVPDTGAVSVQRLEAAGAVIIGKTNMHELAYGITSTNPHYGAVRNPRDPSRIPGGSSGGSGAAVADGLVPVALGSDTGGSIRIPASYCGCVGLKPTYGLVDRSGCQPLGLTLDHVGPLTRTVRDAATVLGILADWQPDAQTGIGGIRFGWPSNYYFEHADERVAAAVAEAARLTGAQLVDVSVPDVDGLNLVARAILLSEAAAVFERFDDRRDDIGADVRALLDQGRLVPAYEYVNAQRLRQRFIAQFRAVFAKCDCLLTPATPNVAPPVGAPSTLIRGREYDVRLAATRFARGINALGFPAVSLPCGVVDGMPVGLQIVGRPHEDALVLRAAAAFEDALRDAGA